MTRVSVILIGLSFLSLSLHAQEVTMPETERQELLAKSDSLFAAGVDLYNIGKFEEAIPIFAQSDQIDKAVLDSTSNRRDYSAMWLASCYYQTGDSVRAEKINPYYRSIPIDRNLTIQSDSLSQIGDALVAEGRFEHAVEYYKQCAEIERSVVGSDHPYIANTLLALAMCLFESGNHTEAIRMGEDVLAIREKVCGKNHPDYRTSLFYLQAWNFISNDYVKANKYGIEFFNMLQDEGETEEQDLFIAVASWLLVSYCYEKRYEEAVQLSEKVMPRMVVSGGESYSLSLRWAAKAYAGTGEYALALNYGMESLSLYDALKQENDPGYRWTLHEVAGYNSAIGKYDEAVRIEKMALGLIREYDGMPSIEYATSSHDLADYYFFKHNYDDALSAIEEALASYELTVGKNDERYVSALCDMGMIYRGKGDLGSMLACYQSALELTDKQRSEMIQFVMLHQLSGFLSWVGKHELAIQAEERALSLAENSLRFSETDKLEIISRLVLCCIRGHRMDEKPLLASALLKRTEDVVTDAFKSLTALERTLLWQKYKHITESLLPGYSYLYPTTSEAARVAYDGALLGKGLLLNSEIEFAELIKESGDEETIRTYENLKRTRTQVNKLREEYLSADSIKLHYLQAIVDSLSRESDKMEKDLISRSKVYGDYTSNLVITWDQVQEKLTDKDIAVEFVSFPLNADSTMYIAYTLRKDWKCPKMIPLFEEKQLLAVQKGDRYTTDSISRLVWKPLDEVMQGVERVYFAPSGELYNIAIESIPTHEDGGETLIGERREYYRLSSTRELALIKDESRWDEAAVYGGLQYGMSVEGMIEEDAKYEKAAGQKRGDSTPSYYVVREDSIGRGDRDVAQGLAYLEGTKKEAEAITHDLERKAVDARLFTDSIGTETSFKALGGKKTSIIHIGTHGFFNDKKKENKDDRLQLLSMDNQPRVIEDDALTRSGLYFAGADNVILNGLSAVPDSIDDGRLTAAEIAQLDLRGLDMVVLSACQTGLGEITGDGVFGLQRGFKKAGAQTIVMSLWKVDDDATTEFMTTFFENIKIDRDGHPLNKHEAFKEAQSKLKQDKGKYSDPYCWAAFVMLDGIR